jgi:hypothetical protein
MKETSFFFVAPSEIEIEFFLLLLNCIIESISVEKYNVQITTVT